MSFVAAKFPLPTVTKPDGTLGGYVQYPVNPGGPQFVWPAQRVAIFLAKQKADKAKKKSGPLGAVTLPPAGLPADIAGAVYDAGPNGTYNDAVAAYLTSRYAPAKDATPKSNTSSNSNLPLYIVGGLGAAAILVAVVKAGRR